MVKTIDFYDANSLIFIKRLIYIYYPNKCNNIVFLAIITLISVIGIRYE